MMEFELQLRRTILEPSWAVAGKVLLSVHYWLADFEASTFQLDTPNLSGLYAVNLVFADTILEIFPGWDTLLRAENAYHIQTRLIPVGEAGSDLTRATNLICVEADQARLWRDALNQPLTAIEVYGTPTSPQLIRFALPSTLTVVAIGYSGETPLLGDGDEILLFSNEQSYLAAEILPGIRTKLWESSSP
jgi:hypothetical protein